MNRYINRCVHEVDNTKAEIRANATSS